MITSLLKTFTITAMALAFAMPAFSAEELFDTAAASKHLEQGISFIKTKQYDKAIREFEESAAINPEAEAYYYIGYAFYLKGRSGDKDSREKSREYFDKAYEIDPNFSPAKYSPAMAVQPGEGPQKQDQTQLEKQGPTITHPSQPVEPVAPQPAEPTK